MQERVLKEFKSILSEHKLNKKVIELLAEDFIEEDPWDCSLYGVTKEWLLENIHGREDALAPGRKFCESLG